MVQPQHSVAWPAAFELAFVLRSKAWQRGSASHAAAHSDTDVVPPVDMKGSPGRALQPVVQAPGVPAGETGQQLTLPAGRQYVLEPWAV